MTTSTSVRDDGPADYDAAYQTRFDIIAGWVENILLITVLLVMVLVASSQIVLREFFGAGFIWADELLRILVFWLAIVGGMAAARVNRHLRIDALNKLVGARAETAIMIAVSAVVVAVSTLFAWHAVRFVWDAYQFEEQVLGNVPAWPFLTILPFGMFVIALYYLRHAVVAAWRTVKGFVPTS
ncbi:MAG: TRAP transporter small permease [Gammaproteobacteria bacterium]|nr:TRAP transporter small permease [Gammaproteobacteria bacterium]